MFDDPVKMNELVSMDPDLAPIKRWQMEAILWPDLADALAKRYGTKEEQKLFKELRKKKP